MIGPFLMLIGIMLIWVAARGKSDPMLKVLGVDAKKAQDDFGSMIMTFITHDLATAFAGAIQGAVSNIFKGFNFSGPGFSFNYVPPQPIYVQNPDPSGPPLQVLT